MKKLIVFICICLIIPSAVFSQKLVEKKEKYKTTHSLGIYGGGGFNHLSEPRYFTADLKNKVVDFGFFYSASFRPTVKIRFGVEGTYMFSDRAPSSTYEVNSKALHLSVPVQFQYTFNPENKVQAYFGVGVSFSHWMNTLRSTTINDTTTTYLHDGGGTASGDTGIEILPIIFVGMNAKIGNNFSVFLQPEYRPTIIAKDNARLRSLIVQLGVAYQFKQKEKVKK